MSRGQGVERRVRPLHWAQRLRRSVGTSEPTDDASRFAREHLDDRGWLLFQRMPAADRRHGIGVAHATEAALDAEGAPALDPDEREAVIGAALLHDVGKSVSGLGAYGRVVATLCGLVAGEYAEHWQQASGFTRRVGLYLRYPDLGGDLLAVNGCHPWIVAWARQHHEPEATWTLPVEVGRILRTADV